MPISLWRTTLPCAVWSWGVDDPGVCPPISGRYPRRTWRVFWLDTFSHCPDQQGRAGWCICFPDLGLEWNLQSWSYCLHPLAQGKHKVIIKPGRKVSNSKRRATLTYSGTIALAAHLLAETREAGEDSRVTTKGKRNQPRILYPAKLSIQNEDEGRPSPGVKSLRECVASRPVLQ